MARRITESAARALALTLPLAACDSDSGVDSRTGSGSDHLTDAAGDVKAAAVTISKSSQPGEGGEVDMMDGEVTTDLLTLANDAATLVEDAVVPAGAYGQLRFLIDGAYVEVENGDGSTSIYATAGYPHVPSGAQVAGELKCPSCGVDAEG